MDPQQQGNEVAGTHEAVEEGKQLQKKRKKKKKPKEDSK